MHYDVVVVGAGPCGLVAGRKAAELGRSVCIIEEHQEVGYPVKCSGLFSVRGVKKLFPNLPGEFICSTIRGGRFYSPNNQSFLAYSKKDRAYVVERKMFDKFLAREAGRKGAEIKLKTTADGMEIREDEVRLKINELGEEKTIKAKVIIGADGVKSNVARWAGIKSKKMLVGAAQIEVERKGVEIEDDVAEVYFGRKYAPNFYAWILPKGETVEIGTACGGSEKKFSPREYLNLFIKTHEIAKEKIKSKSVLEYNTAAIPVGGPSKSFGNRVLLVGDAASQTKATTGGGVITGSMCAELAGIAASMAVEENDFSEKFFKKYYEDEWKKEIGNELKMHAYLRKIFNAASDDRLDALFKIINEEGIPEIMTKYEDTDRISSFLKEVLKKKIVAGWIRKIA